MNQLLKPAISFTLTSSLLVYLFIFIPFIGFLSENESEKITNLSIGYLCCGIVIAALVILNKTWLRKNIKAIFASITLLTISLLAWLSLYSYNGPAIFMSYTGIGYEYTTDPGPWITSNPLTKKIEIGMTSQEITEILGKPDSLHEYSKENTTRPDEWIYRYYFYNGNFYIMIQNDRVVKISFGHG